MNFLDNPIYSMNELFGLLSIFYEYFFLLLLSCPVVSDSLQPHELQHIRSLCPSPSPEFCPSSCSLHWCCHPAISFSDVLFFCFQSFPASGTFLVSQVFTSGDQNTGTSALAFILSMSIQGWFPLRLTGWSPGCPGTSQESSSTTVWRHQFFDTLPSLQSTSHNHTGKTIALTTQTF